MALPTLVQTVGATPGRVYISGSFAFMDSGVAPITEPSTSASIVPVQIGKNSYEVFVRFSFAVATGSTVQKLRVHYSGAGLPTGVSLKYKGSWTASAYTTPTSSTSTVATTTIPTSTPASANISIDNSTSTTKTLDFVSDYLVLQLQTTSSAAAATLSIPLTLTYDLDGVDKTEVFTFTAVLSSIASITPYVDISGVFYDTIDITGVLYEEGGL